MESGPSLFCFVHSTHQTIKAAKDNKKKVTRKRNHLDLQLGENYPPEGHCSLLKTQTDKTYRVITIGGAQRKEESTWLQDGAAISEFLITADEEDVDIETVKTFKTKGKIN